MSTVVAPLTDRRAGPVEAAPLFIIGDHRSGTTVLYQMLSGTGAFAAVTAYHVIRRAELADDIARRNVPSMRQAVDEMLRGKGLVDRGIDGVKVTADLPEEYGFVIDSGSRPRLRPQNVARFHEFCAQVRRTDDRLLLLKNPWDALQFVYIKSVVPGARLVFVHRDPVAIVNSQLRAIRSLLAERNEYVALLATWYTRMFDSPLRLAAMRALFSPRSPLAARIVERHVVRVCEYYMRHRRSVPAADVLSVKYEDVCAWPADAIGRILEFAGADPSLARAAAGMVDRRPPSVLPEVQRRSRAIRSKTDAYRRLLGYA